MPYPPKCLISNGNFDHYSIKNQGRQDKRVKNGVFPAIEQMCVELDNPVTNE